MLMPEFCSGCEGYPAPDGPCEGWCAGSPDGAYPEFCSGCEGWTPPAGPCEGWCAGSPEGAYPEFCSGCEGWTPGADLTCADWCGCMEPGRIGDYHTKQCRGCSSEWYAFAATYP